MRALKIIFCLISLFSSSAFAAAGLCASSGYYPVCNGWAYGPANVCRASVSELLTHWRVYYAGVFCSTNDSSAICNNGSNSASLVTCSDAPEPVNSVQYQAAFDSAIAAGFSVEAATAAGLAADVAKWMGDVYAGYAGVAARQAIARGGDAANAAEAGVTASSGATIISVSDALALADSISAADV